MSELKESRRRQAHRGRPVGIQHGVQCEANPERVVGGLPGAEALMAPEAGGGGFYRMSKVWVVDFLYEGRPRRWFKILPAELDPAELVRHTLQDWYGDRARLVAVREATDEEERQYLRGEGPRNVYCPTG